MKNAALICGFTASVLLTGCYNNPGTSLRSPGEGPAHIMSGPAVGPGSTAGGSTAGPQPAVEKHGSNVEPHGGGGIPAEPGSGHAPTPVTSPEADSPKGSPARIGNEKGPGRGSESPENK